MTQVRLAALTLVAVVSMLLGLLAVPAGAQQPYPPPPPPDGPSGRAEASCTIDEDRTIECVGEGWLAGSSVTVEIRRTGGGGQNRLVAAFTVVVDDDGSFETSYQLSCDYRANNVQVRISGRDAQDRPSTVTIRLRVPPPPESCQQTGVDSGGTDSPGRSDSSASSDSPGRTDSSGRSDSPGRSANAAADGRGNSGVQAAEQPGRTGPLATLDRDGDGVVDASGRTLLLLGAVALVLLTLGLVVAGWRRDRAATGAHA